MTNKLTEVNPTHEVGATRSVETQGATNSSQAYVPVPAGEARKRLQNALVIFADSATLIMELGGLAICAKGLCNLFTRKKKEEKKEEKK